MSPFSLQLQGGEKDIPDLFDPLAERREINKTKKVLKNTMMCTKKVLKGTSGAI